MSGTELDSDGTDTYHPQHPWERSGHPQYLPEPQRTKANWPPDLAARPAGPAEAARWDKMPRGREERHLHLEKFESKPTDFTVTLADLVLIPRLNAEIAERVEKARQEGIAEGKRLAKQKRKRSETYDWLIDQNIRLARQTRDRLARITEVAAGLVIQADISDEVKYGTLSTGTVKEAMEKILADSMLEP